MFGWYLLIVHLLLVLNSFAVLRSDKVDITLEKPMVVKDLFHVFPERHERRSHARGC